MSLNNTLEDRYFHPLSSLTLAPERMQAIYPQLPSLGEREFEAFTSLASANHVVLRALEPLAICAAQRGNHQLANQCQLRIAQEQQRISNAIQQLARITSELEAAGCPTTVMKTLDHWPDLGSDLDLYTTAGSRTVVEAMKTRLGARLEAQSWGDRLACKWNFKIPGLPEAVEVHAQRLGQTGEQTAMAERFVSRRVTQSVLGIDFRVPAPEERIIVATLQRMYRHFYIRICDIANLARLVESGTVNYPELLRAAMLGGIWNGVCSLLRIVSDYVQMHRGSPLALPAMVLAGASFGGEKVRVRARFLRVPIVPQGAELYTKQVTTTALRGDVAGTLRLSLLPYLASAAAISYKFTGSDKGIW